VSFLSELNRRNVLRVAVAYLVSAWLLIQIAETILPLFDLEDAARLVVVILAIGFVPAVVLAWAFELTPEGLKRDADVRSDERYAPLARKRFDRITIAVLGLAVAFFAYERFVLVPERTASEIEAARQKGRSQAFEESFGSLSIAVLPFEDLSPSSDHAWLANGIAGEILNQLAGIAELRVISRSSAFTLRESGLTVPEIAERLDVAHVLEGTLVSANDDRIRVSVRLLEGLSDTQIWQSSYDATLDDAINVQDEVATAVVRELEPRLTDRLPAPSRVSAEAYQQFMRARYLLESGNPREALATLDRIVSIEPAYADAWALIAGAYTQMAPTFKLADHAGDPLWMKAQAAISRVSEIDPEHPIVLLNAAYLGIETSGDYASAARYIERALERNTNPVMVLRPAAYFNRMIGKPEWAIRLLKLAQQRDPLCKRCIYEYGRALLAGGQYERVEPAIREFLMFGTGGGELTIGTARLLAGDLDGAEATLGQRQDEPGQRYGDLLVRSARGEQGLDEEIADFAALDSYLNPLAPAELYAQAGNTDAAFEILRESSKKFARWEFALTLRSPLLAPLHKDPRWQEMMEGAGITPHQLASVEFDPQIDWAQAEFRANPE
jgi:TolB-like protein